MPILFTEKVNHPNRDRFLDLRKQVDDDEKLKEAQQIMVECGAFSYCFEQFFQRIQQARKLLKSMNLKDTTEFVALEKRMLHAPKKILEKIGSHDVEKIIMGVEN